MREGRMEVKRVINNSKVLALNEEDENAVLVHEVMEAFVNIFFAWQTSKLSEDTFIKQSLQAFVDLIFSYDTRFAYNW